MNADAESELPTGATRRALPNFLGPQVLLWVALACAGCHTPPQAGAPIGELPVPVLTCPVTVDGRLDEPCYAQPALVERFVIAGNSTRQPARTRAWLFWSAEKLVFAFDCEDASLVANAPTSNERDVD